MMADVVAVSLAPGTSAEADRSPTTDDLMSDNIRLRMLLAHADEAAAEFALLLREGDHRIKNSLQIVVSLMRLQAGHEANAMAREVLRSAAARIQSMARIHDALQKGGGQDTVDLGDVLGEMCESLHAMAGDQKKVAIHVSVEQIQLPTSVAQPIALIVNELVINALRHAFPGEHAGAIRVEAARIDDLLHIVVIDDGCGLPINYAEGRGYGMKLVRMLAEKIHATLIVDGTQGCRFELIAPASPVFEKF